MTPSIDFYGDVVFDSPNFYWSIDVTRNGFLVSNNGLNGRHANPDMNPNYIQDVDDVVEAVIKTLASQETEYYLKLLVEDVLDTLRQELKDLLSKAEVLFKQQYPIQIRM